MDNRKVYVFPHCRNKEHEIKKIQGISRLFAFPVEPHFENNGRMVIIDSGAYGLSVKKRKMTQKYMQELNEHYTKYGNNEHTICVAPDEFLNPSQTMYNFQKWRKNGFFPRVAAVLQCERKHEVNIEQLKWQAEFYREYTDTIFFSNNGLRGQYAQQIGIEELFRYMKEELNVKWIHVLGAGWSMEDIQNWCAIGYFDSLDSIAYYRSSKGEFNSTDPVQNIYDILNLSCIKLQR